MDNIKKVKLDKLNINKNVKLNTMQADAKAPVTENLQLCNFIDDLKNFPAYMSLSKEQKERIQKYSEEVKDIKKYKDGSARITFKHSDYEKEIVLREDGTLSSEKITYDKVDSMSGKKNDTGRSNKDSFITKYNTIKEYNEDEVLVKEVQDYSDGRKIYRYDDYGRKIDERFEYDEGTTYNHHIVYKGYNKYYEYYDKTKNDVSLESGNSEYDSRGFKIHEVRYENGVKVYEYRSYYDEKKQDYVSEEYNY